MKVTITFEDTTEGEKENDVSIEFDFDPVLTQDTEMTAAGFLATEVMGIISKRLEDKDAVNSKPSIILASP